MMKSFTRVNKFRIVYEWEINEVTSLIKSARFNDEDTYLESSKFSTGSSEVEDSWFLKLRLNNSKSENKRYMSVFLATNNEDKEIRVTYFLYILTDKKERKNIHSADKILGKDSDWGYRAFIEEKELLDNKNQYLPGDTLTLCLDLTVYGEYKSFSTDVLRRTKSSMIQDYKTLYLNKIGSDVTLIVQNQKFNAHKGVLIARSPVLAAMFVHETIESKKNEVTITDIRPEIIEKMLEYIYCDEIINIDNYAQELLEAADKYQIQTLKGMCEESITKSINFENAIRILILADRHSAQQLVKFVTEFIIANAKSIIETEDFKSMNKSNSPIFPMLFEKMAITYGN
ncbi:speckle-type POZ protein-like [Cotesia glomerata]|nr:speckle-type POZ protein-like [Cotesia glomerata]